MFPPSNQTPDARQKMLAWVIIAIGLAVLVAFGVFYATVRGGLTAPMVITIAIALIAAITTPMIAIYANRQRQGATATKAKRGLDGLDMYSVMDRMVDDLDDDEAAYLRQRLDDHQLGLNPADLFDGEDDTSHEGRR
ncbi:MAG: hypothetical protein H6672_21600 [Anaerolineaceae bacterium]|nr:hypothetical protein [Anaerolineaceae bacterium]